MDEILDLIESVSVDLQAKLVALSETGGNLVTFTELHKLDTEV